MGVGGWCGHTVVARHEFVLFFYGLVFDNKESQDILPSAFDSSSHAQVKNLGLNSFFRNFCHPFFSVYSSLIYLYILAFLSHYFPSHLSVLSSYVSPPSSPSLTLRQNTNRLVPYVMSIFCWMSASLLTAHKRSWRSYLHRLLQPEVLLPEGGIL